MHAGGKLLQLTGAKKKGGGIYLAWLKAARLVAGTEPPLEEEQNRSCRGEGKLTVVTVGAAEERAVVLEVFVKGRSCWSWWLLRLLLLLPR